MAADRRDEWPGLDSPGGALPGLDRLQYALLKLTGLHDKVANGQPGSMGENNLRASDRQENPI